jgi:hypothetical protein
MNMGIGIEGADLRAELEKARRQLREMGTGRIAFAERKALAALIARLEQDPADLAFDDREAQRIESLARTLNQRAAMSAEERRVAEILARDKADAAAERFRREAEIEFDAGKPVMMADAVVPPTREQMASGEFVPYTPRQPDGSTREVRTHRRIQAYQAYRMMLWGAIDRDGYSSCCWYASLYEATGLTGSVKSVDYGREVFSAPHSRSVFTEWQIEKQDEWRCVRRNMPSRHLRLLDAVILDGLTIHRAVRAARSFHRTPQKGFAEAVEHLASARSRLKAS